VGGGPCGGRGRSVGREWRRGGEVLRGGGVPEGEPPTPLKEPAAHQFRTGGAENCAPGGIRMWPGPRWYRAMRSPPRRTRPTHA
jgi:hypothetical protein